MNKFTIFFIAAIILETCLVIQGLPYPSGTQEKTPSLDSKAPESSFLGTQEKTPSLDSKTPESSFLGINKETPSLEAKEKVAESSQTSYPGSSYLGQAGDSCCAQILKSFNIQVREDDSIRAALTQVLNSKSTEIPSETFVLDSKSEESKSSETSEDKKE